MKMGLGDCVIIPDGRIGRIRDITNKQMRVRVMRITSHTHQFLWFIPSELRITSCPKGWMSPDGYSRYLKITLAKMKQKEKERLK